MSNDNYSLAELRRRLSRTVSNMLSAVEPFGHHDEWCKDFLEALDAYIEAKIAANPKKYRRTPSPYDLSARRRED